MNEKIKRIGEFPHETYLAILARAYCYICGDRYQEEYPFEAHHRIFLASDVAKCFPLELLRSLSNGALAHRDCHQSWHNQYIEPPYYEIDEVVKQYQSELKQQTFFPVVERRPSLSYAGTKRRMG